MTGYKDPDYVFSYSSCLTEICSNNDHGQDNRCIYLSLKQRHGPGAYSAIWAKIQSGGRSSPMRPQQVLLRGNRKQGHLHLQLDPASLVELSAPLPQLQGIPHGLLH